MRRSQPRRVWSDSLAKCEAEGKCRVCGIERGLQQAHTVGRKHDKPKPGRKTLWVNPDGIVPLCERDHTAFDHHEIDLLPYLTVAEQVYAVEALCGIENARIRLAPRDYHRAIQAARVEVEMAA